MKDIFKNLNWFERIMPLVAVLIVSITFAVGSEKNWLSFVYSIVGVFETFIVAKGLFIAPFFTLTLCVLYLFLSLSQNFYGETIIAVIYILLAIVTIITWLKNRNKENDSEVQVNKLNKWEYIFLIPVSIAIGVGCYFMLRAFNTSELIVSTISMVVSIVSAYLMVRRSKFYAAGYLINDIIVIVLWSMTIKDVGLVFLPTILGFVMYFVSDVYGFVNWKLMELKQKKQKQNEKIKFQENVENTDIT